MSERDRSAERTAKPAAASPADVAAGVPTAVGVVTHFFPLAGACVVALRDGALRVGDTVHIRGHTTDFHQRIERMEVDHEPVEHAARGDVVAVGVAQRVREGDRVSVVAL